MTKEELLSYVKDLVNQLRVKKDKLLENKANDAFVLSEQLKEISTDFTKLKGLNIDSLYNYISIPADVANIMRFYQLILKTGSYQLENNQIDYLKYLIREFQKVLRKSIKEKGESDSEVYRINQELCCTNRILDILEVKERLSLEDFIIISKMVKQNNYLGDYRDELLQNIASYMRYILVGNDYQNLENERKR